MSATPETKMTQHNAFKHLPPLEEGYTLTLRCQVKISGSSSPYGELCTMKITNTGGYLEMELISDREKHGKKTVSSFYTLPLDPDQESVQVVIPPDTKDRTGPEEYDLISGVYVNTGDETKKLFRNQGEITFIRPPIPGEFAETGPLWQVREMEDPESENQEIDPSGSDEQVDPSGIDVECILWILVLLICQVMALYAFARVVWPIFAAGGSRTHTSAPKARPRTI